MYFIWQNVEQFNYGFQMLNAPSTKIVSCSQRAPMSDVEYNEVTILVHSRNVEGDDTSIRQLPKLDCSH